MREKEFRNDREKLERLKNKETYDNDRIGYYNRIPSNINKFDNKKKTPQFSAAPSTPSLFLSSLSSAAKNFALKNTPLRKTMDVNKNKVKIGNNSLFSKVSSSPSVNLNFGKNSFAEVEKEDESSYFGGSNGKKRKREDIIDLSDNGNDYKNKKKK
jgi:hypothetical protein